MADEYPRLLEDRDVVVIGTATSNRPGCADGWMGMTARCRPTGSSWSPAWGATPARIPLRDRTCSRPLSGSAASSNRTAWWSPSRARGATPTRAAWRGIWAADCRSTSCAPDCAARLSQRPFLVTAENQRGQLPAPGVGHHPD